MDTHSHSPFQVEQWISCGFRWTHQDLSPEENQHWYGSLHSPHGGGGNFLVRGVFESFRDPPFDSSLVASIRTKLKFWDHQFLNDWVGEESLLSPESLCYFLKRELSHQALPEGIAWSRGVLTLSRQLSVSASVDSEPLVHFKFRLQSILSERGVDLPVTLTFDGAHWRSQVPKTCIPLGALESWSGEELVEALRHSTLNEWLGLSTLEQLPEALFHQLKRNFPYLKGVSVTTQSFVNIDYYDKL